MSKQLTIIFDMDGVILDSERVYQEIERDMFRELDMPVSREDHQSFMGTAERSMWAFMTEKYGSAGYKTDELVEEERRRFIEKLETPGDIPLMTGLLPLLETLKKENIPCWIASSSSKEIIDKVMEVNRLEKYFIGWVSGDDVEHSKPSPEIFLETACRAGTIAENCIIIEDSENGVKAARAAGMRVVGLQSEHNRGADLSTATSCVKSLGEIHTEWFEKLLL